MEDNATILEDARRARLRIPETLSVDLPPIQDQFTGLQIQSWRHNGHVRDDAIHSIMSRVGGFPTALAKYLVAAYSRPGELVVDPFCGKGTTLYEGALMGRESIGGDVAPDAVLVSRAKCSNVRLEEIVQYIERLNYDDVTIRDIDRDIRTFFHPDTLRQIISVQRRLLRDLTRPSSREVATFVCALMLGILHGHSRTSLSLPCNQCFAMSPAYVRKYVDQHDLEKPKRDVKKCLLERALEFYPRPILSGSIEVVEDTVLECPRYLGQRKGKVSLVLSSPPYLNRQTYVKDSWLRLWFLGRDIRAIARSAVESGSVRLFVGFLEKVLTACLSIVRDQGHVVFVCGEARVTVGGEQRVARISELAIHALARLKLPKGHVAIESLIRDRKKMVRGSYFAVHGGKSIDGNGRSHHRYGEEEILVIRKGGRGRAAANSSGNDR